MINALYMIILNNLGNAYLFTLEPTLFSFCPIKILPYEQHNVTRKIQQNCPIIKNILFFYLRTLPATEFGRGIIKEPEL